MRTSDGLGHGGAGFWLGIGWLVDLAATYSPTS
jgi:hypothetical protein